jgi:hypothetical protein
MSITTRALNRATLHRQALLDRSASSAEAMIGHLVGMQAQEPLAPYVGLWSRVRGFQAAELATLMTDRAVVRAPLLRATIHLVTAADHGTLEPLTRRVLARAFAGSAFTLGDLDVDKVLDEARALMEEHPRTRAELGRLLAAKWPDADARSLAHATTYLMTLVQVTPRGVWGSRGQATWTTAEQWLGTPGAIGSVQDVVRRYLAAYGPAAVKDVQTWSGLTRLREVVDGMDLVVLRDEAGRELVDLPDAPLPDEDTPAPVRFLPEFDNLLLAHHDRTRVISAEDYRRGIVIGGKSTLLVDGVVRGIWKARGGTLEIEVFGSLSSTEREDVVDEGGRLLGFVAADIAEHDVRLLSS